MTCFLDLPVEIVPLLLSHSPKPQQLADASLVNTTFNTFAIPLLYRRISIYAWHKQSKTKVINLFTTLADHAHLAQHVRRLEVRDFPKRATGSDDATISLVVRGLQHCTNLLSCSWTRDGTLGSEILETLCNLPNLREIELNGRSQGQYDPAILGRFKGLTKVTLIMPSSVVLSELANMLAASPLRHLTIICKSSPVLNDRVLCSLAPSLAHLEELYLTGCPKVTEAGVRAVLNINANGIRGLGLEGVSPRFNMASFAEQCTNNHLLHRLAAITVTPSLSRQPQSWSESIITLLQRSPIERFQVYAGSDLPFITDGFYGRTVFEAIKPLVKDLVWAHGPRLKHFSVHRIPLNLSSINTLIHGCPNLEELFLCVEPTDLDALPNSLRLCQKLRTVHINYPIHRGEILYHEEGTEVESAGKELSPAHALDFAQRCGPTLMQFGCNTKVWNVGRTIEVDATGRKLANKCLLPYESQDIPEQFLVVRA